MKKIGFLTYMLGGFAFALFIYLIAHGIPSFSSGSSREHLLREAESDYAAGEKAQTIAERKNAFNLALRDFTQLEKTFHPDYGNGKLYYNLANTNYQLGEYPQAIYYYERALALNPRDEKAYANLTLTLEKLGLKPQTEGESIFQKVFFFHHYFSLPERLTLFFFFSLATLLLISLLIWFGWPWLQPLLLVFGIPSIVLLGSLLYSLYLAPIEGILVKAAILYRDAGEQYAKVNEKPLLPGQKVEVLDIRQNGTWLKILTSDGTLGYVKEDSIKVI